MSSRFPNKSYSVPVGTHFDWIYGGQTPISRESCPIQNVEAVQLINSVNKRVNGKYPPGGDWIAYARRRILTPTSEVTTYRPGFGRAYKGSYYIQDDRFSTSNVSAFYNEEAIANLVSTLESYGAEGWAQARPAKPNFDVATNLLELKDLPGMLKQSVHVVINRVLKNNPKLYYDFGRNGFFRVKDKTRLSSTAEWYLALNFGWLPVIQGIRDFIKASNDLDKSYRQLLRDEGRPIRRRVPLKTNGEFTRPRDVGESTNSTYTVANPPHGTSPLHVTQCYTGENVQFSDQVRVYQQAYFVAQFRYWLPEGPRDPLWTKGLRRRMMGGRVTPSVAWNLMPWTFLLDYFSTLGTAVGNLGPGVEDQLITDWCYVTYSEVVTRKISTAVGTYGSVDWETINRVPMSQTYENRLLMRLRADPFAFRFRGGGPTLKQSAILAALAAK